MVLNIRFGSPYANYAAASNSAPMAYGICMSIGCNYRNVSLVLLAANTASQMNFVYSVIFWTNSSAASAAYVAALAALLPTSTMSSGIIYNLNTVNGGGLATVTSLAAGYGLFAPPPSPAPPPLPPAPPSPPSPPLPPAPPRPPPPPAPPTQYGCTCTHGWSGFDCRTAPAG